MVAGHARPSQLSVRLSVGAVLGGTLEGEGRTYDIDPGFFVSGSIAKQFTFGPWFVAGAFSMALSRTTTLENAPGATEQSLGALDLFRLGLTAGRTFGIVSPYILARGFAGPVSWSLDAMDVTGSDTHFFQLGAGTSIAFASGLTIVVDISALGEQSASLGASWRL